MAYCPPSSSSPSSWQVTDSELEEVKCNWYDVCRMMKVSLPFASEWWAMLSQRYSEGHRHYHTIKHIHFMLKQLDGSFGKKITKHLEVVLAIFFHDFIYDVHAKDNERLSADEFMRFVTDTTLKELGTVDTEFIYRMIILTETHKTYHHSLENEFGSCDEHYLLDIDMAILGQNWNVYEEYARAIRQEYIHVPHDQYCERRAQVLSGFITTSRIFCTELFHTELERAAQLNIEKEISLLKRFQIP